MAYLSKKRRAGFAAGNIPNGNQISGNLGLVTAAGIFTEAAADFGDHPTSGIAFRKMPLGCSQLIGSLRAPYPRCTSARLGVYILAGRAILGEPLRRAYLPLDRSSRRLFAGVEQVIECLSDDTGLRGLRITDLARFEHYFACEADVFGGGGNNRVPVGNTFSRAIMRADNFPPLLRCIVFIGKTALREGLDLQRVSLRTMGGCNDTVMRALGLGESRGALCRVIGNTGNDLGFENFRRCTSG